MATIGKFLQQSTQSTQSTPSQPFFILGPCVMESENFTWEMARAIREIGVALDVGVIFKASYDKANRSSASSFRGPGPEAGRDILQAIREKLQLPVTTDVHTPEEALLLGEVVDIIQIPAFLCRQTDLIEAAAKTGRIINVKKGQFLAPWDVQNIAQKLESFGANQFYFTERGVSFGYNNLVADMRALYWMREQGYQVIFDATHSVQRPGGLGETSGGDGVLAPVLARAAVAVGCDAVFLETHPNPSEALSDGPNQVPLSELQNVLQRLLRIHHAAHD